MKEALFWWLQYLRIFAQNSPWGTPVKFTIWIHAYEGYQLAEIWKATPIDVVDGYDRTCQMIQTKDKTITIQWAVVEPSGYGGPTATGRRTHRVAQSNRGPGLIATDFTTMREVASPTAMSRGAGTWKRSLSSRSY